MRKTPDSVSRERQRLGEQIKVWRAGIAAARKVLVLGWSEEAQRKVAYGEAQLQLCNEALKKLKKAGKKTFWPKEK